MNARVSSMSPRFAAVDPQQQAALDAKIDAARATAPPLPQVLPFQPRVEHVSAEQIAAHPHGLLLALAQHVLLGLQQRPLAIGRDVPPFSADPEAFARQMEVFERMRETERAFKQRGAQ